ncbi:MAG: single-stranded DNA-binding protein [Puniceicoccales bacterium]|jgi:single-strand DNA-binding protein|nr:single-stranded DNA-binding protein [Puniceicoccales bacterium]
MASFNKVILAGNLTRDPDLRTFPNGTVVAKFGLAVNRRYTSKEGEQREEVTFVDIDSFGKQAETISKYCTKGSSILVEGRLKLDTWEDKNTNEKRNRLGVVLETFTFIGGRGENAGGNSTGGGYDDSGAPARRAAPANSAPARPAVHSAPPPAAQDGVEDDVPF